MRRLTRLAAKGALIVVLGLAVLGAGSWLYLQTSSGRAMACGWLEETTSAQIRGELRIGRCTTLSFGELGFEAICLEDDKGTEVARIDRLTVELDPIALLKGTVHIQRLALLRPTIRALEAEGRLRLLDALEPTTPSTDDSEPFPLSIERLTAEDGSLLGLEQGFAARAIQLEASLSLAPHTNIEVDKLDASILRRSDEVAKLRDTAAQLRLHENGHSTLRTSIAAEDGGGRVEAGFDWSAGSPTNLRAVVEATFQPAMFTKLGLDGLAAELRGSFVLHGKIEGELDRLRARAGLTTAGGQISLVAVWTPSAQSLSFSTDTLRLDRLLATGVGSVSAKVDSDYRDGKIEAQGSFLLDAVQWRTNRVQHLTATANVHGPIPHLTAEAQVNASDLRIDGNAIDKATLQIEGTQGHFNVSGRVSAKEELDLNLRVQTRQVRSTRRIAFTVDGDVGLRSPDKQPLRASLQQLDVDPGRAISMEKVIVTGPGLDASAHGRFALTGRHDLEVQISKIDLAELAPMLGRPWSGITGVANGRMNLTGNFKHPAVDATIAFSELRLTEVEVPSLTATLSLSSATGRGNAHVQARLQTPAGERVQGTARGCDASKPLDVVADVQVERGIAELRASSLDDALTLEATVPAPIRRWLMRGVPRQLLPTHVRANAADLNLSAVPYVCEFLAGRLSATAEVSNPFTPRQQLRLHAQSEASRLQLNEAPATLIVDAQASATRASVQASATLDGRPILRLDANAPLRLRKGAQLGLEVGKLAGALHFEQTPLDALLAGIPIVANPQGIVNGSARLSGDSIRSLAVIGEFELSHVSMTLRSPYVRLSDVSGHVLVNREQLVLRSFTSVDRRGKIKVDGRIGLVEWQPTDFALTISAKNYPLRQEGILFASLTGLIDISGKLDAPPNELQVTARRLELVLPPTTGNRTQTLAAHQETIYEDMPGFDRSLTVADALRARDGNDENASAEPTNSTTPASIRFSATEPFWVRHDDFAVQLTAALEVHTHGDDTRLLGPVEVRRGFVELLGKLFTFESGTIRFAGEYPVDPTLNLTAVHELPTRHTVTVHITGRASDPELRFSTSEPGATTDTEIVALLLGVRRRTDGETRAENQTQAMMAGLMAGLVGSLARREFGRYVPMLAIESAGSASTTRVRAGFQLNNLVPKSWRDTLLGVYLEGYLGGSDTGRTAGGFLLELLFPHSLVTSTTYEPPDNWSLDLLWEP